MRQFLICAAFGIALTACSAPLERVPRLSDVEVSESAGQAEALPSDAPEALADARAPVVDDEDKPRGGLLGFLRRQADNAGSDAPAPADVAAVAGAEDPGDAVPEAVLAAAPPPATEPQSDAAPRRGLLGGLLRGGAATDDAKPGQAPRRRAREPKPGDPDYQQVGPGVTLPYGQIARLCGVSAGRLGKKVGQYPERGAKYTLYDSAPGGQGMRNFYVTGFDDGCARQFSAALVLFGTPEVYEQIRYGLPAETQPVAETDRAYEALKSRVCRVGRGKPCGARMKTLSRDTVFLSIYERFGTNARWKNLLLHDGAVLALDVKSK